MEWLLFAIGTIGYLFMAWTVYNEGFRSSSYYVPVNIVFGAITGSLWAIAVKVIDDSHKLYVFSAIWDGMIVATFMIVPIVVFGVRLSKWEILGVLMLIGGMVVLKSFEGH